MVQISDQWQATYPGAALGILVLDGVNNPASHETLEDWKKALEEELRDRFAGAGKAALKNLPAIQAYSSYYKRFKKTYHVLLQLQSVVLKGRPIPKVAALVESMFMAELKNQLLTAGHDLEVVQPPIRLDIAQGDEQYIKLNGQEQLTKTGDMMISDGAGPISTVIYGPDRRTRIRPETRRALFTVYAPPGIGEQAVADHLHDIWTNVGLFAPKAVLKRLEVYGPEG